MITTNLERNAAPAGGGFTPGKLAEGASGGQQSQHEFRRLKKELHQQLIAEIDPTVFGSMPENQLRSAIRERAEELSRNRSELITIADRERLVKELMDEVFGLGPLQTLLSDPSVSDILINGHQTVYVERRGRMEQCRDVVFNDEQHLLAIVQRICERVGRRLDETSPMVDARLPDGSRVNAIIPPLALDGTLVSIRRFGADPLTAEDLLAGGSMTREVLDFLSACVRAGLNIVVSGGTGSGKTTLLNTLSGFIDSSERIATIEDAAELQLQQPHVVRMETRAKNIEGEGEVTTADLVRNALRMRPDRIVVGECRGPEALHMLQAMNTGHDGCMTTIHANDTRDAVSRLEMLASMAADIPIWIIRRQITSAVHLIVQTNRLSGGPRKITRVSEVTGMEGDVVSMHDLFVFTQTGLDQNRVAQGHFSATGVRPLCMDRLASYGIEVPETTFQQQGFSPAGGLL